MNPVPRKLCIGPLQFTIAGECGFDLFGLPDRFEEAIFPGSAASYEVTVRCPAEPETVDMNCAQDLTEGGDFREYRLGNAVIHDYFECIGQEKNYVRTRLCGHEIGIDIPAGAEWLRNRRHGIWEFLMPEKLFAKEGAFILHSASVVAGGKAVLFSAPSGTGKSTQAELWKKYVPGIVGFNGDRNLLVKWNSAWYICGLPWHGSSPDCENGMVPVAGIALLKQADADAVRVLSEREKFIGIYAGVTQNPWDRECTVRLLDAVGELVRDVPVCRLFCTMEESAVDCLKGWLDGVI